MTYQKAKMIFATHMADARKRKLTAYEREQLSTARQVLRQHRKPAMNPSGRYKLPVSKRIGSMKVGDGVEIKGTGIIGVITKQVPPKHTEFPDGSIKVFEVFATRGAHGSFFKSEKELRLLRSNPKSRKANPSKGKHTLIYGAVNRIYATKTQGHNCDAECARNGHRYFHDFKSKPKMYGLPDGSILIK